MTHPPHLTFGAELETVGLDIDEVAELLKKEAPGAEIDDSGDSTLVKIPSLGGEWSVVRDGSLPSPSAEVVSPVLVGQSGLASLKTMAETLSRIGAISEVTYSLRCGLHIHVGLQDASTAEIVRIIRLWTGIERVCVKLVQSVDREEWSKILPEPLRMTMRQLAEHKGSFDETRLSGAWYQHAGGRGDVRIKYDGSRYHTLNLHSYFYEDPNTGKRRKTLEFRLFDGTLDPDLIEVYVLLCLNVVWHGSLGEERYVRKASELSSLLSEWGFSREQISLLAPIASPEEKNQLRKQAAAAEIDIADVRHLLDDVKRDIREAESGLHTKESLKLLVSSRAYFLQIADEAISGDVEEMVRFAIMTGDVARQAASEGRHELLISIPGQNAIRSILRALQKVVSDLMRKTFTPHVGAPLIPDEVDHEVWEHLERLAMNDRSILNASFSHGHSYNEQLLSWLSALNDPLVKGKFPEMKQLLCAALAKTMPEIKRSITKPDPFIDMQIEFMSSLQHPDEQVRKTVEDNIARLAPIYFERMRAVNDYLDTGITPPSADANARSEIERVREVLPDIDGLQKDKEILERRLQALMRQLQKTLKILNFKDFEVPAETILTKSPTPLYERDQIEKEARSLVNLAVVSGNLVPLIGLIVRNNGWNRWTVENEIVNVWGDVSIIARFGLLLSAWSEPFSSGNVDDPYQMVQDALLDMVVRETVRMIPHARDLDSLLELLEGMGRLRSYHDDRGHTHDLLEKPLTIPTFAVHRPPCLDPDAISYDDMAKIVRAPGSSYDYEIKERSEMMQASLLAMLFNRKLSRYVRSAEILTIAKILQAEVVRRNLQQFDDEIMTDIDKIPADVWEVAKDVPPGFFPDFIDFVVRNARSYGR